MDYPAWVNEPTNQSLDDLAHKRVAFILRRAALSLVNTTGFVILSKLLRMNHSRLCTIIKRGWLPKDIALEIEALVGPDIAPWQLLCDPLNGHKELVNATDDDEL
jgi:hypothetical protein